MYTNPEDVNEWEYEERMSPEEVAQLLTQRDELLAALEEITGAYERLLQAHGKPFEWGAITSDKARAAIAKAKGE